MDTRRIRSFGFNNKSYAKGDRSQIVGDFCLKGNELIGKMIERIPEKIGEPCDDTGNLLLTNMVKELNYPIKIYPSHYFMPVNHGKVNGDRIYSEHLWGTTTGRYSKRRYLVRKVLTNTKQCKLFYPLKVLVKKYRKKKKS